MAKNYKSLTSKQTLAINALLTGASDTEAAKLAGVHRMTISDWKNSNPYFIQELNRLQNEARRKAVEPYQKRLDELVTISIDTLSNAIKRGDSVSARWLLDKVGQFPSTMSNRFTQSFELPEPQPEELDDIIDEIAAREVMEILKQEGKTDLDFAIEADTIERIKNALSESIKHQYYKEN